MSANHPTVTLDRVRKILDKATGDKNPPHGRFWHKPLSELLTLEVKGERVLVSGKPAESALVRSLRGKPPFDSDYERMPSGGSPPVPELEIQEIERWIENGCKE